MNTYNFNKWISCLFKLGFIALAILGLSLTAQASSAQLSSAQLSSALANSDLSVESSQSETLQSTLPQQPSCANSTYLQNEGSVASTIGNDSLTPNTSWLCICCYAGNIGCCIAAGNSCRRLHIDTDAT